MKNKTNNKNIKGGARTIPIYNGQNYMLTQQEKEGHKKHYQEKQSREHKELAKAQEKDPKTILSLTVTDEFNKPKPTPVVPTYPTYNIPVMNPYNTFPTQYATPMNNIPIIKKYNISLQGADNNITAVAEIFEDILPQSEVAINKSTTLNERLVLYSYIRSILVSKGDGEEISFTDKKNPEIINLLSYMKMLEINPYHFSRLTNNPYRTMPENFVMFRSCYPIRLDRTANYIKCAKDSVNTNVRIYSLSNYDYLAYKYDNHEIKKKYSDIWREVFYYQYIREEILKKKMCPHFPLIFSFYITKNSGIDFDKIQKLKKKFVDKNESLITDNNIIKGHFIKSGIHNMLGINTEEDKITKTVKQLEKEKQEENDLIDKINKLNKINFKDNKQTLLIDGKTEINAIARSGNCVVVLTESPNQNIINWSTRTYIVDDGPTRKQISTGVHSIKEWQTIIFQLLVSMYVMEQKQIVIKEMTWKKNIFIKDLESSNTVGYWKYIISGLEYYIPNLGNLLMIDSSFDDLTDGLNYSFIKTVDDNEKQFHFKLYGKIFEDNNTISLFGLKNNMENINLDDLMIENFNNIFNNNFGPEFTNHGGIKPPQEIIDLLSFINKENYKNKNKNNDIIMSYPDIILKYFYNYLHNKIGYLVSDLELRQLFKSGIRDDFNTGELVAIKSNFIDSLRWGIYIDKKELMHKIFTSFEDDNKKFDIIELNSSEISKVYGIINQNFDPDQKLLEEELLETYTL